MLIRNSVPVIGSSISAILSAVRILLLSIAVLVAAGASMLLAQQTTPEPPSSQQPPMQQGLPAQPPPAALPPGPVIVLDPAHGGTDPGARGPSGTVEKDIVLQYARTVRAGLERQGYRVVMTRNDDSNPSHDDRTAIADNHRDAIFITLHVSSTGTIGTARAYYCLLSSPLASPASSTVVTAGNPPPTLARPAEKVYMSCARPFHMPPVPRQYHSAECSVAPR